MHASLNRRIYFLVQKWRKEPVKQALLELEKSMSASYAQLDEIQNQRLLALLQHAVKTVPFYQKYYAPWKSEIQEASEQEVKELVRKLPTVQKQDIIKNREGIFSTEHFTTHTNISSGTTGEPFAYPCDQLSWAYRHASLIRIIEYYGVSFGSRYGYFFGQHWKSELRLKTRLKDWFFNRDRFSAFDISHKTVEKAYRSFVKKKTKYIVGYASTVTEFCKLAFEELHLDPSKLSIKLFVATGETLEDFQKTFIQRFLNCEVVNYYGSAEGGFGSFTGKEGLMQENMETCYLELDEHNRISKTDLFLRQFPLIKIQTDDICVPLVNNLKTDLKHRVLGKITGRTGEKITLPNGKKVHAVILDYFFDLFVNDPNILKFRFEFSANDVKLKIKSQKEELDKNFTNRIYQEFERLFPGTILAINLVEEIPNLANGKNRPWVQL